jgi:hypothetical protein
VPGIWRLLLRSAGRHCGYSNGPETCSNKAGWRSFTNNDACVLKVRHTLSQFDPWTDPEFFSDPADFVTAELEAERLLSGKLKPSSQCRHLAELGRRRVTQYDPQRPSKADAIAPRFIDAQIVA